MLKHDGINIVIDFWPLFVKQIANSLDFGDLWQIILYFGLSTWTHIEYWIKSMVTYLLFWIHNNTYEHLWSIVLAQNHELLPNKTVDHFFHQLVLHILCKLLWNAILFMHTTYRHSMFSVLLQFKDLISENMKISNKVKIVGKGNICKYKIKSIENKTTTENIFNSR